MHLKREYICIYHHNCNNLQRRNKLYSELKIVAIMKMSYVIFLACLWINDDECLYCREYELNFIVRAVFI